MMYLNINIIRVVILLKDHLNLILKMFVNFKLKIILLYIALLVGVSIPEKTIEVKVLDKSLLKYVNLCIHLVLDIMLKNLNKLILFDNYFIIYNLF